MQELKRGEQKNETANLVALAREYFDRDELCSKAYETRRQIAKTLIAEMEKAGQEWPVSVRLADGRVVIFEKDYHDSLKLSKPAEELT